MARDLYEILGVSRDASEGDIKKAYRNLAREYHPDRNPGNKQAEQRFKEIQSAYEVLGDKDKRTQYDRFGRVGPEEGFAGGPGGNWSFQWGGGKEGINPEDIFRNIFGGGDFGDVFGSRGGRGARPGGGRPPVASEVQIPFATAALGGKVSFRIDNREIEVKIPPGVQEGQTLRLGGQGPGGADLHLKLRIQAHPYFRRENKDLILEAPISLTEAVLGAKIEVPTLDGTRLSVKVPPGTSSGTRLRLRGRGIAGGDQYIEVKVVVPSAADERTRQLMDEFSKLNPQDPRGDLKW